MGVHSNNSDIAKKMKSPQIKTEITQLLEYEVAAAAETGEDGAKLTADNSAQVHCQLLRQHPNGDWFKPKKPDVYWVHLDNAQECAPRNTHIVDPVILNGKNRSPKKAKKKKNDARQLKK